MTSILPPQNLCHLSASNSTVELSSSTSLHLSNLEKLLGIKQPQFKQFDHKPIIRKDSGNGLSENRRRSLMEGLNLAKIWPEMNAGDEISPRRLNHLQKILSKSPEYSPRNHLGTRWREYHGCDDWNGLLDPLDENLRREVVKYGEFIQSAYRAFHSNPDMSFDEESPAPQNVVLPDRSYRVTKKLYATSSIGLPNWVDDMAPDLGWMSQRSSCIGYVAVCDDRREIQRMGRRDIVIALRGTATCLEWAENVRAQLVQISDHNDEAKVECGFLSLFSTRGSSVPSLAESVVDEIHRLMELYEGETLSITVTGHSLGAALALLVADELSTCAPNVPPVAVFSFGGPRVGNQGFVNQINSKNVKVLRIVNNQDVITKVPGMFVNETVDKSASTWVYTHVGTELRVDTKMSPYLKPNADIACCHDLEAYLHLVDGFLASNCPFRATAKRSIATLLKDQNSNVKKLYTRKAKALGLNLEFERFPVASCLPSPS